MTRLFKRKKGSGIVDGLFTFLFAILVFFIFGISLFILNEWNDAYSDLDVASPEQKEMINNYASQSNYLMDGLIVFLVFGSWIVAMLLNYFLDNSNLFFIIFLILNLLFMLALFPLSNFITVLISDGGAFAWVASTLPMSTFILQNMALFFFAYLVSNGVVLYVKGRTR